MPYPDLLHPEPLPLRRPLLTSTSAGDTQTLKGKSGSVSVGSPGVHKILFEPSEHVWWVWDLILNVILLVLLSCWGFSFALGRGVSFFSGIQHSPVHGCSATSFNFGVLVEDECMSFYSAILNKLLKDWTVVPQMSPFLDKTCLFPHGGI